MSTVDVSNNLGQNEPPQQLVNSNNKRKSDTSVSNSKGGFKKPTTRRASRGKENSENEKYAKFVKHVVAKLKVELSNELSNQLQMGLTPMQKDLESIKSKLTRVEEKVPSDVTPETTLTSRARSDLTAGTEQAFLDHLNTAIKKFVRDKFFSVLKFADEKKARTIVLQAERDNRIQPMKGQPKEAFYKHCTQVVMTTFNTLRGYMQSQARKNFLSKSQCSRSLLYVYVLTIECISHFLPFILDVRRREAPNRLPEGFPGTVGVAFNPTKNPAVQLNDKYRRYEYGAGGDGDFLWFVENVLSAQNVLRTKFAQRKSSATISEIFTIQDEAFALVVLLNEFHCWEVDWKKQQRKKNPNAETHTEILPDVGKKFVNKKSGKKQSWDDLGRTVFYQLCNQVQKRREEDVSKRWEAAYMHSHTSTSKTNEEDNLGSVEQYSTNENDPLAIMNEEPIFPQGEEDFFKLITVDKERNDELVVGGETAAV